MLLAGTTCCHLSGAATTPIKNPSATHFIKLTLFVCIPTPEFNIVSFNSTLGCLRKPLSEIYGVSRAFELGMLSGDEGWQCYVTSGGWKVDETESPIFVHGLSNSGARDKKGHTAWG
uniref:Uncharacterized protein n=1 Tax=Magallana gigas TaxID=29159 RepID=K1QDN5_MAGGI